MTNSPGKSNIDSTQASPQKNRKPAFIHRWFIHVILFSILVLLFLLDDTLMAFFSRFFASIKPYGTQFSREMGNYYVTLGFAALFVLARRAHWRKALVVVVAVALTGILINIIKPSLGRHRPKESNSSTNFKPFNNYKNPSQPSGHSGIAMANALMFSQCVPGGCYVFYPLAIFTGLSRIEKNAHYPSDVFAGYLCAYYCCGFILRLARKSGFWDGKSQVHPEARDSTAPRLDTKEPGS